MTNPLQLVYEYSALAQFGLGLLERIYAPQALHCKISQFSPLGAPSLSRYWNGLGNGNKIIRNIVSLLVYKYGYSAVEVILKVLQSTRCAYLT